MTPLPPGTPVQTIYGRAVVVRYQEGVYAVVLTYRAGSGRETRVPAEHVSRVSEEA